MSSREIPKKLDGAAQRSWWPCDGVEQVCPSFFSVFKIGKKAPTHLLQMLWSRAHR
jgi:hypothetical protein